MAKKTMAKTEVAEEAAQGVPGAGKCLEDQRAEVQAKIYEMDQRAGTDNPGAAMENVWNWLNEVRLLEPVASMTETVDGHLLEFRCPRAGAWLRALPHLQEAFGQARKLHMDQLGELAVDLPRLQKAFEEVCNREARTEEEMAFLTLARREIDDAIRYVRTGGPMLSALSRTLFGWNGAALLQTFGVNICRVLDEFLGKAVRDLDPEGKPAPSWAEENLTPSGLLQCVRNYVRVIPVEDMRRFFGEIVGAWQGQAAARQTSR